MSPDNIVKSNVIEARIEEAQKAEHAHGADVTRRRWLQILGMGAATPTITAGMHGVNQVLSGKAEMPQFVYGIPSNSQRSRVEVKVGEQQRLARKNELVSHKGGVFDNRTDFPIVIKPDTLAALSKSPEAGIWAPDNFLGIVVLVGFTLKNQGGRLEAQKIVKKIDEEELPKYALAYRDQQRRPDFAGRHAIFVLSIPDNIETALQRSTGGGKNEVNRRASVELTLDWARQTAHWVSTIPVANKFDEVITRKLIESNPGIQITAMA